MIEKTFFTHRPQRLFRPAGLLTLLGLILLSACGEIPGAAPVSTEASSPAISVLFTDPYAPTARKGTGGPDEPLAAAIAGAQKSVDIAVLNLSLNSVSQAMVQTHQRGVKVRLVLDDQYADRQVPAQLASKGIPIMADGSDSLMHNKFAVIDGNQVWTGSMNFTGSGTYEDHNLLALIDSTQLARDYTTEFEEMFARNEYSAGSPADTPYPQITLDGRNIEVFFAPEDRPARRLNNLLQNARDEITILAYSFTSDTLTETILERAAVGVRVRGVFEAEQVESNTGGDFERLHDAGLDVHRDGLPGQMHIKAMVVDRRIVAFGSYNFTYSAENRNDENLLIVEDAALVEQFLNEFEKIYAKSEP